MLGKMLGEKEEKENITTKNIFALWKSIFNESKNWET